MSNQMEVIIDYLAEAEGIEVHLNKGELDITSMYGIYRFANPHAKIFKELDYLAYKLGIRSKSKDWKHEDLHLLNNYIALSPKYTQLFRDLAIEFYKSYYRGAKLDLFHEDCVIAMASMYANSNKLSWKSVQYAINTMASNNLIEYHRIAEDGKVGSQTMEGLKMCKIACDSLDFVGLLFESFMLLGMTAEYSKLVKANPDKYLRFSIGWDNRMKKLQGAM